LFEAASIAWYLGMRANFVVVTVGIAFGREIARVHVGDAALAHNNVME
jgi:hypothetical protein